MTGRPELGAGQHYQLLSVAVHAAANGILVTDRDGVITWVNPAFTEMTGYSFDEVYGQTPRVLKSGQQAPTVYADLWATIVAGRIWRGELVNRRKDGSLYTEEETITPVRDARGEITHFIAIKQDITERKLGEEAL